MPMRCVSSRAFTHWRSAWRKVGASTWTCRAICKRSRGPDDRRRALRHSGGPCLRWRRCARAHRRRGTTGLLPTLISDSAEKMRLALQAVNAAVGSEPGILGLHLEGPYLSPEKPGVHDRRQLRQPSPDELAMLTAPRNGVLLVTLAPEIVPTGFIAQLVAAGIRVSLGHSMASYQQTRAAMAEGLTGFTHLFNVMRPLSSREGGPIALALESPDAWYGLIVDGVHVDPAMLRLALRGLGHPILVSDA